MTYSGSGGVSVASYWRRLLYGWKFKEPNFLISGVFNADSKVLYNRDPRERVEKVAPFLTIDGDPYPAVVNGRITWILDGYTTASTYPYSNQVDLRNATSDAQVGTGVARQADQTINYMRNSVKATVDAYDGTVTLYQFGANDPILDAWNKAFGGNLVKPVADIPPDAGRALPLPGRPVQGAARPVDALPRHEPAGLLLRPGLLAGAQRPGEREHRSTAAVLPARAVPEPGRADIPAHGGHDSAYAAEPFGVGDRLLRRGRHSAAEHPANHAGARTDPGPAEDAERSERTNTVVALHLGQLTSRVRQPTVAAARRRDSVRRAGLHQIDEPGLYPLMKKVLLNYGDFVAFADDTASGIADLLSQAKNGVPSDDATHDADQSVSVSVSDTTTDSAFADPNGARDGEFRRAGRRHP